MFGSFVDFSHGMFCYKQRERESETAIYNYRRSNTIRHSMNRLLPTVVWPTTRRLICQIVQNRLGHLNNRKHTRFLQTQFVCRKNQTIVICIYYALQWKEIAYKNISWRFSEYHTAPAGLLFVSHSEIGADKIATSCGQPAIMLLYQLIWFRDTDNAVPLIEVTFCGGDNVCFAGQYTKIIANKLRLTKCNWIVGKMSTVVDGGRQIDETTASLAHVWTFFFLFLFFYGKRMQMWLTLVVAVRKNSRYACASYRQIHITVSDDVRHFQAPAVHVHDLSWPTESQFANAMFFFGIHTTNTHCQLTNKTIHTVREFDFNFNPNRNRSK